jgi:hypothetical protein
MRTLCIVTAALLLAVVPHLVDQARADGPDAALACAAAGTAAPARLVTADRGPGVRGAVVVPVSGKPVPRPLPAGTIDGVEAVRGKVSMLGTQVKTLEPRLTQRDWSQAVQSQLPGMRNTHAALQQDVLKLQAANRSANLAEGIRLSNNLHARVQDVGSALAGLGQSRDAASARGFLTKISVSLDGIIKNVSDEPLCCAQRTCCYVGIR